MTTWCTKTRLVSPTSSGESLHKGCMRVPSGRVKLHYKPVWIACFTVPCGELTEHQDLQQANHLIVQGISK